MRGKPKIEDCTIVYVEMGFSEQFKFCGVRVKIAIDRSGKKEENADKREEVVASLAVR